MYTWRMNVLMFSLHCVNSIHMKWQNPGEKDFCISIWLNTNWPSVQLWHRQQSSLALPSKDLWCELAEYGMVPWILRVWFIDSPYSARDEITVGHQPKSTHKDRKAIHSPKQLVIVAEQELSTSIAIMKLLLCIRKAESSQMAVCLKSACKRMATGTGHVSKSKHSRRQVLKEAFQKWQWIYEKYHRLMT